MADQGGIAAALVVAFNAPAAGARIAIVRPAADLAIESHVETLDLRAPPDSGTRLAPEAGTPGAALTLVDRSRTLAPFWSQDVAPVARIVEADAPAGFAPARPAPRGKDRAGPPISSNLAAASAFMTLGEAVPAPLGYLSFCARRPDQCDLQAPSTDANSADDTRERTRKLYGRYYWAVAFKSASIGDLGSAPTAGVKTDGGHDGLIGSGASAIAGSVGAAPTLAMEQPASTPRNASLTMSDALMATLQQINARINHSIHYMNDEAQYGQADYWTLPLERGGSAAGDCKDYVLEKRRALIAAGLPSRDLAIAIARTPWGETHAVLLVTTDRGEYVLDSLSSWVLPWRGVHYQWLERQAPGQQLAWVRIVTSKPSV